MKVCHNSGKPIDSLGAEVYPRLYVDKETMLILYFNLVMNYIL